MIATHICPRCASFLVAMSDADMVELKASHLCAGTDRNQTLAFGFPVEQRDWLDLLTVEDARLLHSMRIDPL